MIHEETNSVHEVIHLNQSETILFAEFLVGTLL